MSAACPEVSIVFMEATPQHALTHTLTPTLHLSAANNIRLGSDRFIWVESRGKCEGRRKLRRSFHEDFTDLNSGCGHTALWDSAHNFLGYYTLQQACALGGTLYLR
jgi:hypothetical protein